ncbi:MAG: helix-turn-helix transcriptional regulator [Phenylobacterium sp.]|nr:helix-turn-helix transcriptional regulator [Phenylobacterium sp.]
MPGNRKTPIWTDPDDAPELTDDVFTRAALKDGDRLLRPAQGTLTRRGRPKRDLRAYDRAKAALASGAEELIPADMLDRMLAGESPVKLWRQHRGLTQSALAAMADLSEGYLSQIETGKRDGTVESFKRLAEALGVAVDDLI